DGHVTGVQTCALPIYVERVVLLPPAENLNGAVDFLLAADQRIDLAVLRLLVEVDAISFQRIALFLRLAVAAAIAALGVAVLVVRSEERRVGKEWRCWL